jgi:type VI secretion system protein ImpD/type VI secretion system protein ImpC
MEEDSSGEGAPGTAEAGPPPSPPAAAALRDAVLAGAVAGSANAATAEALAALIAGTMPVAEAWFGAGSPLLRADAETFRLALDRDIAALDALIAEQLDAILHHPRLRRLEASWRGLAWLADQCFTMPRMKLKLIPLPWPELVRDLERAIEFDQSRIFEKIYEGEFGTPGGEPFGLIVGDYAVRHRRSAESPTDDVAALGAMAGVAAAAFAPFVVAADPALFGLEDFGELSGVRDLAGIFRSAEYDRWRNLQAMEDSRFLGIVLPRVLTRLPHANDGTRADRFVYAETATHRRTRGWTNAVYAFAAVVARAAAAHGWPADVKGTDRDRIGGGLVTALAVERFAADRAGVGPRFAAEVALTDRQDQELSELGFIPLTALRNTIEAAFGACRSVQVAKTYVGGTGQVASANARLSAQLSTMLCVSRFAHYIKVIGRDRVGSYATPEECEAALQKWLSGYVNANTRAGPEMMARYPLADARVSVSELPGRPGHYGCTIHLQPQFQLDDIAATFRLVTEVPARQAA